MDRPGARSPAPKRHVHHEIVPRQAGNLQQFPVQRIVLYRALRRARITHKLRTVQDFDGFLRRQSGRDQLASAGKAQHQVRLNEAEGDV